MSPELADVDLDALLASDYLGADIPTSKSKKRHFPDDDEDDGPLRKKARDAFCAMFGSSSVSSEDGSLLEQNFSLAALPFTATRSIRSKSASLDTVRSEHGIAHPDTQQPFRRSSSLGPYVVHAEIRRGFVPSQTQPSPSEAYLSDFEDDETQTSPNNAHCELKRLRMELHRTRAENKVLRKRPAPIDPLYAPLANLPEELRVMVRTQLLRLDRPVTYDDLWDFIMCNHETIVNGLHLPEFTRSRYLSLFLRVNTIDIEALTYGDHVLGSHGMVLGFSGNHEMAPHTMSIVIRQYDLERSITGKYGLTARFTTLRPYVNVHSLNISFSMDRWFDYYKSNEAGHALDAIEGLSAIQSLPRLLADKISLSIEKPQNLPKEAAQEKSQWARAAASSIQMALAVARPSCVVTVEEVDLV